MFIQGGLIPNYLLVQKLGLINSMWALILPAAINVWFMIIMRTFFQGIPDSLFESAHMDGANDLTVFFRIVVPLSIPLLATMVLFYSVFHWNSFFPALIYLNEQAKYPMQIILRNIVIQGSMSELLTSDVNTGNEMISNNNIKYAVIIVTIVPILFIYPFIQKYFVKGVTIGSLKG
jgi:putative aldouronate transport system permease protein